MIKKTDQVRSLVRQGRYKDALRIAKGFRLGITREQSDTMVRAYECMVHPDFYRSIGKNTQECIDGGVAVLCQIFGSYPHNKKQRV